MWSFAGPYRYSCGAPALRIEELQTSDLGESSDYLRQRVQPCRRKQVLRFANTGVTSNAGMTQGLIRDHCRIGGDEASLLRKAMEELSLSARAYDRILKVARTIADLDGAENIKMKHLLEAIQDRSLDRDLFT